MLALEARSDLIQYGNGSPTDYAISANLHRRHLSETQRGMVGARVKEFYTKLAKERQKAAGGDQRKKALPVNLPELVGDARDQAGKAVGVSGKTVGIPGRVVKSARVRGVPEGILGRFGSKPSSDCIGHSTLGGMKALSIPSMGEGGMAISGAGERQ